MKNKKTLLLVLIVLLIVIGIIIFFIWKNKKNTSNTDTNDIKIKKGYELFGDEYCKGHNRGSIIVDGWPSYSTCKICGITKHNDAPHSDFTICLECAEITGRCSICGKLLRK